ncbi:MAG: ThiF family adenylyltransferase [Phycisphaerales bacterium]|nr:ThiF family adenylyltransferase [Phycisphaerales bacterium]
MLVGGIGASGQRRLAASTGIVVGCGALGCASTDLLARAGVGRIVLVDRDVVELTNLQRQCLFDERDVAEQSPKAHAAAARLAAINSQIVVEAVATDVTHRTIEPLMERFRPDVILDGTDNFQTRFLLNDAAIKRGVPLVYAGVLAGSGMQMTVRPGITPCLRCIFDGPPTTAVPTCDTAGVLGPAVAIAAANQAIEGIKLLAGLEDRLSGVLLQFDLLANTHRLLKVGSRRADCACCGRREFEFLAGKNADTAAVLCGRNAVQIWAAERGVDLEEMHRRLAPLGSFARSPVLVRGVLREARGEGGEPIELTVFADGRTLVRGTASIERARGLHARFVGG